MRSLEVKVMWALLFTHDIGDDDGGGEEDEEGEQRDHDDDAGSLVPGLHRAQRQQLVTHLHSGESGDSVDIQIYLQCVYSVDI